MLDTSKIVELKCYVCKQHIGYAYFNKHIASDKSTFIERVTNPRDDFKAFIICNNCNESIQNSEVNVE